MSLTALNRQRGTFKTIINKIKSFITAFQSSEDSIKDNIELNNKLTSVKDILKGLDDIKIALYALPDDVDLKDSLEITVYMEEEAQEIKVSLLVF
ncbi:hypothetical protein AVEN_192086-1 [Araneus ventricosus]|uniref:Uncharacterized protein n=1 Tax=Araneus ventricosus TaxID=182803 RepID=A0A4Y2B6H3_ARAVE|nr:hypothetical protein AVEN_192086-1 [Araneus ventricosus]